MFKNIFARVWALWGIVSFIATFLIFFIPSMLTWLLPDPQGQRIFCDLSRLWMHIWLRLVGCPVTIKGREHFQKGRSYIVTCNHNSLMDVPLSSPFIPGPNKTIAKSSFTKIPLFGFYYMKGAVLVNRNSDKSRKESFEKMKEVLRKGMHMCIYPEGTRNRSAEPLKSFYDGAFKLAVASEAPIIPAVIFNTGKALPVTKKFFFFPNPAEFVDFNIPWQVNVGFSLAFSNVPKPDFSGFRKEFNSNLNFSGSFSLTPKWNFSANGFFDFDTRQLQSFQMSINREMHCWQMSINVTPVGIYRSFSFSVSPKSSILQDLKINRTRFFSSY